MTTSDERLPNVGSAEPASEHDPELAEEYAESVSIDPTPEEVSHYLELVGDPDEQGDTEKGDTEQNDTGNKAESSTRA